MNILHIIDDEKFIDSCYRTFSDNNIKNFVLKSGCITIDFIVENQIEIIFIHYLKDAEIAFLSENKINIPLVWMFWGADGFNLPLFYNNYIGKDTKHLMRFWNFRKNLRLLIKDLIKDYFRFFINLTPSIRKKINVINSFSYIIPIVPEDFEILTKVYPSIRSPFFHFNYITPIFSQRLENISFVSGNNILVGNSASPTNNHIEVFNQLNKLDVKSNRTVIIPLNYGDDNYRSAITEFLRDKGLFNAMPLIEFLEFSRYKELLDSCEIMIMNHIRQQALGNIIIGLVMGASIYLNSKSPIFKYLEINDFKIFDFERIDFGKNLPLLTDYEKRENRKLAIKIFGNQTQREKVNMLLSEIVYK